MAQDGCPDESAGDCPEVDGAGSVQEDDESEGGRAGKMRVGKKARKLRKA